MEPEEQDIAAHQRINRIGVIALKSMLILLTVLAVYLILFPIAVYLGFRWEILKILEDYPVIDTVGAPLEWFARKCPPYEAFLEYISRLLFETIP